MVFYFKVLQFRKEKLFFFIDAICPTYLHAVFFQVFVGNAKPCIFVPDLDVKLDQTVKRIALTSATHMSALMSFKLFWFNSSTFLLSDVNSTFFRKQNSLLNNQSPVLLGKAVTLCIRRRFWLKVKGSNKQVCECVCDVLFLSFFYLVSLLPFTQSWYLDTWMGVLEITLNSTWWFYLFSIYQNVSICLKWSRFAVCNFSCSDVYAPVCGYNEETYYNLCEFEEASCR